METAIHAVADVLIAAALRFALAIDALRRALTKRWRRIRGSLATLRRRWLLGSPNTPTTVVLGRNPGKRYVSHSRRSCRLFGIRSSCPVSAPPQEQLFPSPACLSSRFRPSKYPLDHAMSLNFEGVQAFVAACPLRCGTTSPYDPRARVLVFEPENLSQHSLGRFGAFLGRALSGVWHLGRNKNLSVEEVYARSVKAVVAQLVPGNASLCASDNEEPLRLQLACEVVVHGTAVPRSLSDATNPRAALRAASPNRIWWNASRTLGRTPLVAPVRFSNARMHLEAHETPRQVEVEVDPDSVCASQPAICEPHRHPVAIAPPSTPQFKTILLDPSSDASVA